MNTGQDDRVAIYYTGHGAPRAFGRGGLARLDLRLELPGLRGPRREENGL